MTKNSAIPQKFRYRGSRRAFRALMLSSSHKPGCMAAMPASQSCRVRRVLCMADAHSSCVQPVAERRVLRAAGEKGPRGGRFRFGWLGIGDSPGMDIQPTAVFKFEDIKVAGCVEFFGGTVVSGGLSVHCRLAQQRVIFGFRHDFPLVLVNSAAHSAEVNHIQIAPYVAFADLSVANDEGVAVLLNRAVVVVVFRSVHEISQGVLRRHQVNGAVLSVHVAAPANFFKSCLNLFVGQSDEVAHFGSFAPVPEARRIRRIHALNITRNPCRTTTVRRMVSFNSENKSINKWVEGVK